MKATCSALLSLAIAGSANAGDVPPLHPDAAIVVGQAHGPMAPDGFGSLFDVSTVSFSEFFPRVSSSNYDSDAAVTGTRWITNAGSISLYAPLPLEHGVLLGGFDIYYLDNNAAASISVSLCRYWRNASSGGSPGADCVASFVSAGSPGYARAALPVPAQFGTILRRADVDGDTQPDSVDYVLIVSFGTAIDGSVRISHVRPYWRRQVTPAPAVATFPNDVPTSHPFFRFIEALYASGITAGCAGGSFCPNQPVTRGELAVFLAAALGLHWPAF